MTRIYDIAHKYVDDLAAIDPSTATALGIPGGEREMSDYSPAGYARTADLNRRTLEALGAAAVDGDPSMPQGERDRIAKEMISERLRVSLDLYDAGEHLRGLRIIGAALQRCRSIFDDMPKTNEDEWANIAARLALVPAALAGYRETLDAGIAKGQTAARRQALECAKQAETWAGLVEGQRSYFDGLAEALDKIEVGSEGLRTDVGRGVRLAREAFAGMGAYLRDDYAPKASEREGSGDERYHMLTRLFIGANLDLNETYVWGWEQLHDLERQMEATAQRIKPGASIDEATDLIENDPARSVEGVEAYREWLQALHDEALTALHGKHFDIPDEIRRIEVMIPPAGSAAAAYYTGPTEDFARPGRTWWPTMGRTRFPKWGEVTTAYHEGVPGHHLQVGGARCLGDKLSRYQRLLGFISGYGEGWALYSERLMGELGYLEDPDHYMGLLSAQALRAVRVIMDIGMHLELPIPATETFHPGETWNHDLAVDFSTEKTRRPREFMASEVVRYLGWPAQAISYKVGERFWLDAREAAKAKSGADFDLKTFHSEALDLGPMGLAQLKRELGG
jgi:uncharacterized protein (DUF885 family)